MKENNMSSKDALVVFKGAKIRRTWHDDQWFYSVVDIIRILTESGSSRQYWGVLKKRDTQLLTICLQLKLPSSDGKYYNTDCVNTENAFRLIQSIPSKKAEPFKRWLAKVGYKRVQEIEDPELAQKRMKEIYKSKGYSDVWIEKRVEWEYLKNIQKEKAEETLISDLICALDSEHGTGNYETLQRKIEKSIEKLREYCTSLISTAVTGKIDVREDLVS
jgi:prophage antirepressor-like protein